MKLALNCARVAGTEILDRAAAKGLARVLDLPGPAARCWAAAAAFAKADASARVVARARAHRAHRDVTHGHRRLTRANASVSVHPGVKTWTPSYQPR